MNAIRQVLSLGATAKAFLRSQSANVAIMFGFAIVPLIGMTGAAIDYSRAASDRTRMQSALDTTALMLAREAPGLSEGQIQKKAEDYFKALMGSTEVYSLQINSTYTGNGGTKLDLLASGTVDTTFMGLMGVHQMPIRTASTAQWGNTRLRVSLVLDNTGSMASDGKMTALKTATTNLLKKLQGTAKDPEDVYVSIIPFGKDVNANKANVSKPWVRWDLWDAANGSCKKGGKSVSYSPKSTCLTNGGTWTPANHSTWNGCVTDRDQDYDTNRSIPQNAVAATLFPAEQYSSCPVPLIALTNDWSALNLKVSSMIPTGNTNQTIGLQWGMQSLLADMPLMRPSYQPGYTYQHIIIMLTDGLNTENRYSKLQNSIDARTRKACDEAKNTNNNITIYSIQVNTGGDPKSQMLQDCASGTRRYYHLTDANAIVDTFDEIGTELSKLRLSL
jgi:Flp pilus assembly protein TadG